MVAQKTTILLIDDDSDLRETLADGLQAAGYEIIQDDNVQSVMNRLPSVNVSVAILDLVLSGVSGATLLGYIKAHPLLKDVKTIIMSGFEQGARSATFWGADVFIQKPVTIAGLLKALAEIGIRPDSPDSEEASS
jgi:DNA-binding NtrC family response regulator